jgi:hypothetical protein
MQNETNCITQSLFSKALWLAQVSALEHNPHRAYLHDHDLNVIRQGGCGLHSAQDLHGQPLLLIVTLHL